MLSDPSVAELLGPLLTGALEKKGFTELTPVQRAVLDPSLSGRDLRITSQTGSGKTVAIGLVLRDIVTAAPSAPGRPRALVITPTRELAKQVETELSWLFAPLGARVASVIGGANYRDERRALAAAPAVVVATPGRLVDYLERGGIDASEVGAVVLDEADRMLDMGFRDELEAILKKAPTTSRKHLVSATFAHDVRNLADRVQSSAAHVEGTRLGAANADIDHVVHLVAEHERGAAIINLLLAHPDEQILIFARTRADVADLSRELDRSGFRVRALSGDMEQEARQRSLADFRRGGLRALVATDVAARGIDVEDVTRIIQTEPPTDPDSYTHRSGRTGRAGRKGTSSLLVAPHRLGHAQRLLARANVRFRIEPIPSAADLRAAADERFVEELTRPEPADAPAVDERLASLAAKLAASEDLPRVLVRLLAAAKTRATDARDVTPVLPPTDRKRAAPSRDRDSAPRGGDAPSRGSARASEPPRRGVAFDVSWGEVHGADTRRLLAMACRRGGIRGDQVGFIRIGRTASLLEVAPSVADAFAIAAAKPDPRDPRIKIRRAPEGATPHERRPERREHAPRASAPSIEPGASEVPAPRPSKPRAKAPLVESPVQHEVPAPRPSRPRAKAPAAEAVVEAPRSEIPAPRPSKPRAKTPVIEPAIRRPDSYEKRSFDAPRPTKAPFMPRSHAPGFERSAPFDRRRSDAPPPRGKRPFAPRADGPGYGRPAPSESRRGDAPPPRAKTPFTPRATEPVIEQRTSEPPPPPRVRRIVSGGTPPKRPKTKKR